MIDNEETREWRKPTDEESEEAMSYARSKVDRASEICKIMRQVTLIVSALLFILLVSSAVVRAFDVMAALIIFLVLCALGFIAMSFLIKRKAKFKVRQCEDGNILVRDNIVIHKHKVERQDSSGRIITNYYVKARIVNSRDIGSIAEREHAVSASVFDKISKGTTFVEVRYDPELDGYPYFIIDQLWSTCK